MSMLLLVRSADGSSESQSWPWSRTRLPIPSLTAPSTPRLVISPAEGLARKRNKGPLAESSAEILRRFLPMDVVLAGAAPESKIGNRKSKIQGI